MDISVIVIAVISLYLLFLLFRTLRLSVKNLKVESTVLRVAVSKLNERGPIVAEQIYAALHGLEGNYTWKDYLLGKPKPRISLEIASVRNVIQFFIWTPRKYKNVIESQIYAQYPDVEIEEVEDYTKEAFAVFEVPEQTASGKTDSTGLAEYDPKNNIIDAKASRSAIRNAITAELSFTDPAVYPVKRYPQFEDKLTRLATESIAGVTATLSKLNATDEQAWIQITMEPVGDWWRKRGLKCLKIVSNGLFENIFWMKKLATRVYLVRGFWMRTLFSPIYVLFWILRGFRTGDLPGQKSMSKYDEDELDEQTTRSHEREDPISAAVDKVTKLTFDTNIRIVYIPRPENKDLAQVKLNEIAGSFRQFNMPNMNGFQIDTINQNNLQVIRRYQQRLVIKPMPLNVEELATIYHMPSKDVGTPNVFWVNSKRLEPPHDLPIVGTIPDNELTIIGETNFRGHRQKFGIKTTDRQRHIYIIGKTGMGKSVLLENMIRSDIEQKKGVAIVDPHGDLADAVINFVPSHRINDVVILDPSDLSHPFAFNMLESGDDPHRRNLIASGLLGVFKKMYAESWGPRLEHILRNCLLALAETPNTSMMGIMRILVDDKYRKNIVEKLSNPMVRSFWIDEFGKMQEKFRTEAISPIQNKVGQFLSSTMIRNIVGQVKSTVNIRFMMDTGKIIIVNLSKGKIGEDSSSLLGSMLITKFQLDAMSRADTPEKDRKDFYLYVDEFQNFATDAFATILSEARKYKLNLTMANQYVAQMPDEVRDAVFGNVGTTLSFQVGFDDAEYFSNQFSEEVLPNDIVSLPKYNCYTKLMIDGMPSRTFSFSTLPPPPPSDDENRKEKIIRLSRERYCTPREVVEDKINRWAEAGKEDKKRLEGGKKKFNEGKKYTSNKSEEKNEKKDKSDKPKNTTKPSEPANDKKDKPTDKKPDEDKKKKRRK